MSSEQIPVSHDAVMEAAHGESVETLGRDLAYRRLAMVNVAFIGPECAGDRGWTLVDAGLRGTGAMIRRAAAERFGEGARPAAIVLTHGHFDHVGELESLSEEWDAPVLAHPLEKPYLTGRAAYPPGDAEVGGGVMPLLGRFFPTSPVDVSARLRTLPEDGSVPGLPEWRWIHTPGHSVGHVSFWRERDRVLLSGDAVISTRQESAYAIAVQAPEIHGPPAYFTVEWDKAAASARTLEALEPEVLVPGHGRPMQGAEMRAALSKLAGGFETTATPGRGRYVAEPARAEDGSAYR